LRPYLNKQLKIPVQENDVLAIDWLNGRRTPDANQELKKHHYRIESWH
jgi:L-ribulokinase